MDEQGSNCNLRGPIYMPDGNGGSKPAPYSLTDEELIVFARLNQFKLKKPANTLRYYRTHVNGEGQKILKSRRISNGHITLLPDAIDFVKKLPYTDAKNN